MFPLVLIILHFTCFLFTDTALVISLWKNYDGSPPVWLSLLCSAGSFYFPLPFLLYTSPVHQTHPRSSGSMGTSRDNRKPACLAKRRATLSHTGPRLAGFTNSQLRRYLICTLSNSRLQVTKETKPAGTKFHCATLYTPSWRGSFAHGHLKIPRRPFHRTDNKAMRITPTVLKNNTHHFAQWSPSIYTILIFNTLLIFNTIA